MSLCVGAHVIHLYEKHTETQTETEQIQMIKTNDHHGNLKGVTPPYLSC